MHHTTDIERCLICLHARGCHDPDPCPPKEPFLCDAAPRVLVCPKFAPPPRDKYDHSERAMRIAGVLVMNHRRELSSTPAVGLNELYERLSREIAHAIERAAGGR